MTYFRITRFAAAAALVVSFAGAAEAQDRRVRITNGTSQSMTALHSARPGTNGWTPDILAGRRVAAGGAVTVNFRNSAGRCDFDVRAVFTNGTEQVIRNINVCEVGEMNYTE